MTDAIDMSRPRCGRPRQYQICHLSYERFTSMGWQPVRAVEYRTTHRGDLTMRWRLETIYPWHWRSNARFRSLAQVYAYLRHVTDASKAGSEHAALWRRAQNAS